MPFNYDLNGSIMNGVGAIVNGMPGSSWGGMQPLLYTNPKDELLASRSTAWLNSSLSNMGGSRHAVMVDENGWIIGSRVLIRMGEDSFRTYCLYDIIPVIMSGQYDVKFVPHDIFILQVDGPKSLQIIEKAFQTDFHDLKFAQNRRVFVGETEVVVHRLGMTGALAYEMQGDAKDVDKIYDLLIEAGDEFGMKRLGVRQYMCGGVHTPGGYPNHIVHNAAPGYFEPAAPGKFGGYTACGSAKDDYSNYYLTLFEMKWDYLIDWDHEFVGKEALKKQAESSPRTAVTLIWDREDVGRVFAAGIYDPDLIGEGIDDYNELLPSNYRIHCDKVFVGDEQVGVSMGRCIDYHTNQFVSLCFIDQLHAAQGGQVEVLWGEPGGSQYHVKATVAPHAVVRRRVAQRSVRRHGHGPRSPVLRGLRKNTVVRVRAHPDDILQPLVDSRINRKPTERSVICQTRDDKPRSSQS